MMTRRTLLAAAGLAPFGLFGVTGCGSTPGGDVVQVEAARAAADPAARTAAVDAVTAFTADLYRAVAGADAGNVVCSPYSVATALGMVAQGAKGATLAELLAVLHGTGPDAPAAGALIAGLNGLEQALAAREVEYTKPDGSTEKVALRSANSLWGQRGTTWQPAFLEVLARELGAGMHVVDYRADAEGARGQINRWVGEQTRDRIPELLPAGLVDTLTRLVLVNALYFKAGWREPFEPALTRPQEFTRLDGSAVQAPTMFTGMEAGWAQGRDWVAADLPYAHGELAMLVVLPAEGRFAAVEKGLDAAFLASTLSGTAPNRVAVGLPKWTIRSKLPLKETLGSLGLRTAFTDAADFTGMTADEPLKIGSVIHEGWIAVDEAGTEAAAATAVSMVAMSASVEPPKQLIADRPFLYVIHDVETTLPLFVGRVVDPTA